VRAFGISGLFLTQIEIRLLFTLAARKLMCEATLPTSGILRFGKPRVATIRSSHLIYPKVTDRRKASCRLLLGDSATEK